MKTAELDFDLSPLQIAKAPLAERGASRLMLVHKDGNIEHRKYAELHEILVGQQVYLNNSKVRNRSLGRAQQVFASVDGSVVAPSAGLDITEAQLAQLDHRFLTLHCGVESVREIQTETVEEHDVLVAEAYEIPDPPNQGVVAIGTSVVKALETFAETGQAWGVTRLFICPPFEFVLTKSLLTNFHSPRDTHLALTCAFAGVGRVMEAYQVAIKDGYRFGAYGDAMLLI